MWLGLRSARPDATAHRRGPFDTGVGGLVAEVQRIPPVLHKPQAAFTGLIIGDRGLAVERRLNIQFEALELKPAHPSFQDMILKSANGPGRRIFHPQLFTMPINRQT